MQRIHELTTEKEELSTQVSLATRPLLRQLEHLHSASSTQATDWERQEHTLHERIRDVSARAERAERALEDSKRLGIHFVAIIIIIGESEY